MEMLGVKLLLYGINVGQKSLDFFIPSDIVSKIIDSGQIHGIGQNKT